MAPEAFRYSEIDDLVEFGKHVKMTESETVRFWTKVWESFDFGESQRIDTSLEEKEQ